MRNSLVLIFMALLAFSCYAEFTYIGTIKVKDQTRWGNFSSPSDMFPRGNTTYVLDTGNSRIAIYQNGDVSSVIGGGPNSITGIFYPQAFFLADDGKIYIANTGTNNVLIYDNGNFAYGMASPSSDAYSFERPSGISIYGGRIYVSDTGRGFVSYYELRDRTYSGKIGSKGFSEPELTEPHGIDIKDGTLYIADTGNNRVQVFNLNGEHIRAIRGAYDCSLYAPQAVATGPGGTLFVSDSGNNRVVVFDSQDRCIEILKGSDSLYLYEPRGLRLDSSNNLYVADSGNGVIQVFHYIPYYESRGNASARITDAEAAYARLGGLRSAASHLGVGYSAQAEAFLGTARSEFEKGNYSNSYFNSSASILASVELNSTLSLQVQGAVLRIVLGDEGAVDAIENDASRHGVSVDTGPVRQELARVRAMLDAKKYIEAAFNATLVHAKVLELNASVYGSSTENSKTRNELLLAISDARNELSAVASSALQYNMEINSSVISSLLDQASESCSSFDFETCRVQLSAARGRINDAKLAMQARSSRAEAVRPKITAAYEELSRTYASAFFIKPDLSQAERSLSEAESLAATDPDAAAEKVKNALVFIEGSKAGINRTNQLILIGLGAAVFILILLIGIYYVTRNKPGKRRLK